MDCCTQLMLRMENYSAPAVYCSIHSHPVTLRTKTKLATMDLYVES